MSDDLVLLLQGQVAGELARRGNRISFEYAEEWRTAPEAYPLSLSMPLSKSRHDGEVIENYLWNLLPDNEMLLARWGQRFGVSNRNLLALLAQVGEDLAGAVQIVRPDRRLLLEAEGPEEIAWLSEEEVEERLRAVKEDAAATRLPQDSGQFSLAGAQPKTAFLARDGRWGIPSGRTPTTHILKPPAGEWSGMAENEHFCLRLAHRLGFPVAHSTVQHFGAETAIVVERYDRLRRDQHLIRVHQEDLCQALGVHPANKYENEGGPGVPDVVRVLRSFSTHSDEDVSTFLDALALNWLIGGTDAHGKNFSILHGARRQVRLAPLYDVVSRLAYDPWHPNELRLAMRIGNEYVLGRIHALHWEQLANRLDLTAREVWLRGLSMAERLPDALRATAHELSEQGLGHEALTRLVDRAIARAEREARVLREALRIQVASARE